jgi:signal transduction histidine kinase
MFRNLSLWFKLIGALAAVIMVTLVVTVGSIVTGMRQEFGQFMAEDRAFRRENSPRIMRSGSDQIVVGPFPEAPEVYETFTIEELPPYPESASEIAVTPGSVIVVEQYPVPDDMMLIEAPELDNSFWKPRFYMRRSVPAGITAPGRQFLDNVRRRALIAVAITGSLALVLGTILFRGITRPLNGLRRAAQSLAEGNLSVRVPVKSKDEVGKMAEAFNHMAEQIEYQEELRKQMVADVAHELRTPLTVMQGSIEAMLDGVLEPSPDELAVLHGEVRCLGRLVEDLRLLSLADAGQLTLNKCETRMGDLVEGLVSRIAPLAETQSITLKTQVEQLSAVFTADEHRIQQALANLIDNALRHTPPGGQVTVEAARINGSVSISVTDSGPGITADELPYLFERFWRGDKSRSRDRGGSGLGLSIVKQLVELHGGSVQVESEVDAGSTFTITLPVDAEAHHG